jgi:hypothetical protein
MGKHRTRRLLGCGVLRLTDHRGVSIRLPLKPELLRMIAALNAAPSRALHRQPRDIVVLAR